MVVVQLFLEEQRLFGSLSPGRAILLSNICGHDGEDILLFAVNFRLDEYDSVSIPVYKAESKQCSLSLVVFSK